MGSENFSFLTLPLDVVKLTLDFLPLKHFIRFAKHNSSMFLGYLIAFWDIFSATQPQNFHFFSSCPKNWISRASPHIKSISRYSLSNKQCKETFWSYRSHLQLNTATNKSVLQSLVSQPHRHLNCIRRIELYGNRSRVLESTVLPILPQLCIFGWRSAKDSKIPEKLLDGLIANCAQLERLTLYLPLVDCEPQKFINLARNLKKIKYLHLYLCEDTNSSSRFQPAWRDFVMALPPSLEHLHLNLQLSIVAPINHFPKLKRMSILMDKWLVDACYDAMLPRITESTSLEHRLKVLDHWKGFLSKLQLQLPGALALNCMFTARTDVLTPWGEDVEFHTETLLNLAVSKDWVPVEVLEWLQSNFSGLNWDGVHDPSPLTSANNTTIIEEAFRSSSTTKLMWILKTLRPNLLSSPHRLPQLFRASQRDLEVLKFCLAELFDASVAKSGLTFDQLDRFFCEAEGSTPSNLLLSCNLSTILPILLESPDLLHRFRIDLNAPLESTGGTVLHKIALHNLQHDDAIDRLLQLGANPSIKDKNGRTCIDICIQSGQARYLPSFLKHISANSPDSLAALSRENLSQEHRNRISSATIGLLLSNRQSDATALFALLYLKDILDSVLLQSYFKHGDSLLQSILFVVSNWPSKTALLPPVSPTSPLQQTTINVDAYMKDALTKARIAKEAARFHIIEQFVEQFPTLLARLNPQ